MAATALTPAQLDTAALQAVTTLVEPPDVTQQFNDLVAAYDRTAPADGAARRLVTKTVAELEADAGIGQPQPAPYGTRPPFDIKLPGLLARALPDWAHLAHRTDISHGPSTQLYVAAHILREWGWQQKPHHLRDLRGRRCLCGAICAAVSLGVGIPETAHRAAAYVLAELRRRGQVHETRHPRLIGDWNQMPGRRAEDAIDVTLAAANTAAVHEAHPRAPRRT
ncbi:DUF6197 family protein [Streptomyces nanshensis]|uniref:DUF6197 family protein n=1 Tax=Streptomyces nanshensis TaxID=518642 RepID=UPI00085C3365|nr:hypothetical protein [Streptomyces nanshensis]